MLAFAPLRTFGVPVTEWYRSRSSLPNQYPWPAV